MINLRAAVAGGVQGGSAVGATFAYATAARGLFSAFCFGFLAGLAGCGAMTRPPIPEPSVDRPLFGTWKRQCVCVIGTYKHDETQWMVLKTGEHDPARWVPVAKAGVELDGCTHRRDTGAALTAPPQAGPKTKKGAR